MRTPTPWLTLSCLALALSCEDNARRQGAFLAECAYNDECTAPLVCAARRCRVECRSDRDCSNNWRCLSAGVPHRYVCYPPEQLDVGCVYSADCRASWVCSDRQCRPQCNHDYDCRIIGAGLYCLRSLHVCSSHPHLTDAGTLPDVDINDPNGFFTTAPPDVPVAADVPVAPVDAGATDVADAGVVDAPDVSSVDAPDVPVDAGDPFACALRERPGTCDPATLCAVVSVGIGSDTRCAVMADGSVRCWGSGNGGLLGTGSNARCRVAGLVPGLTDAVSVGIGNNFACARRRAGAGVVCWGTSYVGELGNGTSMGAVTPMPGMNSAMDGELHVGNSHSCTLRAGGAVSCWGNNGSGEFGNGRIGGPGVFNYYTTPQSFSLPAASLSLGVGHSCSVAADGTAYCWGSNLEGALGDGTTTGRPTPMPVPGLSTVAQVVAAQTHSCARLADGTVRCWGGNSAGQLGDGTLTGRPSPITPAITGVAELAVGSFATCARRTDGTVWCWGSADSSGVGRAAMTPTQVPGLPTASRIYGGAGGFCALVSGPFQLWCWGRASGNVDADLSMVPVPVSW